MTCDESERERLVQEYLAQYMDRLGEAIESGGLEVIRVADWTRFGWLQHGFSTRRGGCSEVYRDGAGDGSLNLGFTKEDTAEAVARNRAALAKAVAGAGAAEPVTVRQVHAAEVMRVSGKAATPEEADGLITAEPGVLLAIQVADCVPVLVADVRRRVVGAFHAGWRGTVARIVEHGIAEMQREFGCNAEDLVGAIGPSIRACCYTVGEQVSSEFGRAFGYAEGLFEQRDGDLYLDLAEANRRQLLAAGVRAAGVTVVAECTACARVEGRRRFFSHRAEHGVTGRAMGVIGVAREG